MVSRNHKKFNRGNGQNGHNGNKGNGHRNGQGNGQGNGHGNGQKKWCKHCQMTNHNTADCSKKPGGQQNGVKKNNQFGKNNKQGNNGNNQNQDRNQNQNSRGPCTRCGLKGHSRKECYAKEVPEDEYCDCGCEFHRSNQCPWNNDPLERDAADAQATGKICQWCKDDGDGMHVYDECREPKSFRVTLLKNIHRAYDELKWCWHCSGTDHTTRACTTTSADVGRVKWNAKITDMVQEWVNYDTSSFEARYRDEDEDIAMVAAKAQRRPPMPADYKWCIVCEDFGHYWQDSNNCDSTEWERRCPLQFKNVATVARKPFTPARFGNDHSGTGTTNTGPGTNTFFQQCMFPECFAKIGPWIYPCPPKGQEIICPKCGRANRHPTGPPRRDSKVEVLELVYKLLGEQNKRSESGKRSSKQTAMDNIKNPYLKRPSLALSKKLAHYQWPEMQPTYNDLTLTLGKEPIFKDNGWYFNSQRNDQTYFPASKFKIQEVMMEVAMNDELCINKAGRLGLRIQCLTCGMPALVCDEEGDLVMCGSDPMCTVGCGVGFPFWCDEYGFPRERCKCLAVIGQVPNVAWLTPSR